jgi:hypothetical protein
MFPECSLNVPSTFPQLSLNFPSTFTLHTQDDNTQRRQRRQYDDSTGGQLSPALHEDRQSATADDEFSNEVTNVTRQSQRSGGDYFNLDTGSNFGGRGPTPTPTPTSTPSRGFLREPYVSYRNPTFRSRRRSSSNSDGGQETVERRSKRGQETVERGSKGSRKVVERGTPSDDPPDDDQSLAKLDQSMTNPLANYMLHSPQGFRKTPCGSEMVVLRARGSVSDRAFYETRADHVHWSDDTPNITSSHAQLRRRLRMEGE